MSLGFKLSYEGSDSDAHQIDFYDVAQGLIGFQRSLAITTHLVLNGQVITQAPSLKNAQILASPPKEGSWEVCATILAGTYMLGTAAKDTPIGHLIHSAYDYIVSNALGFHVDYDQSLGQQYQKLKGTSSNILILEQSRFDSALEKCENAIKEMHRPIYANGTATIAKISSTFNGVNKPLNGLLTIDSYNYIHETILETDLHEYTGRVSMYNANTFKGRIYVPTENRPIPFLLADDARTPINQSRLADSLAANVKSRFIGGDIKIKGYKFVSKMGHLKGFKIVRIEEAN